MTDNPEDVARHNAKMAKKKQARDKIMATKTDEKGLIIVHTGKGKGKSTSAFGMIFRCIAHNLPSSVVQFIKGGLSTGERDLILANFSDRCQFHTMGEGFTWETQDKERDIAAAQAAWAKAKELIASGEMHMVLLDEINIAIRYSYVDIAEVIQFLTEEKPPMTHVVLTGRNAHDDLIELADLVTEMTLIKHPFRSGIKAQIGVEFLMRKNAVMIQGAGSNVGKSLLVAGLCRVFTRRGIKTRPFKPQNMSNNAAVTIEGGEIGRAQALQARACYADPTVHMNPVLLKPETDTGAQVIVQGSRFGSMRAREYGKHKAELLPKVLESFDRLYDDADLVIIEGAGSPAEVNLRAGDIANMGFAEAADVPVILVGDIDRGGVIASLVGTANVLEAEETARIKGFMINKFRGDTTLFHDGMTIIEDATGWQGLGILPWFNGARTLPAEDILDLTSKADRGSADGLYHVAVPVLRRIANFDDLDPLVADPKIKLSLIEAGTPLPLDADMVLLPGSKSTIADLEFLRMQGWDIDLKALARQGAKIVGLCGGYQMMGKAIHDPQGLEGAAGSTQGLGFLDIETSLEAQKQLNSQMGWRRQPPSLSLVMKFILVRAQALTHLVLWSPLMMAVMMVRSALMVR